MTANGFRFAALNAVLVILVGMALGGFPLVWVVVKTVYGAAPPLALPGDYRAWNMAHLEGILNGLLMLALAAAARLGAPEPKSDRLFVAALLAAGWGNALASVAAPLLGVRGMTFDADPANNLVAGIFTLALVAGLYAIGWTAVRLARRG